MTNHWSHLHTFWFSLYIKNKKQEKNDTCLYLHVIKVKYSICSCLIGILNECSHLCAYFFKWLLESANQCTTSGESVKVHELRTPEESTQHQLQLCTHAFLTTTTLNKSGSGQNTVVTFWKLCLPLLCHRTLLKQHLFKSPMKWLFQDPDPQQEQVKMSGLLRSSLSQC